MRIIYKEPGKDPRQLVLPNELKPLQDLVGGYIESVTFGSDWLVLCNEEGRLMGMPYNCEVCGVDFVGPIIFVGYNSEGDFTDFPASVEQLKKVMPDLWAVSD